MYSLKVSENFFAQKFSETKIKFLWSKHFCGGNKFQSFDTVHVSKQNFFFAAKLFVAKKFVNNKRKKVLHKKLFFSVIKVFFLWSNFFFLWERLFFWDQTFCFWHVHVHVSNFFLRSNFFFCDQTLYVCSFSTLDLGFWMILK